jgi:hypothetical protein
MPELLDRTIDATWATRLLARRHPGVEVTGVAVLDETSGSANRLRLHLTYRDGADAGLPPVMFLKRNLERFNFPVEMYTTEVRLYRDVFVDHALETPRVFAIEAGDDDVDFAILMEDLSARDGARIGFVLDPTTPDDVDSVLATVARLHAHWWGGRALSQVAPWLTPPTENAAMAFWMEFGPRLTRRHLEFGHRARFVDESAWPQARMWQAFAQMLARDDDAPHTLLHGDVHAGNVYYVAGRDGGLLDWQLALRGCWALDVAYLLTSALTVDDRRAHERALLDAYLDRLRGFGIDPPPRDDAWTRYRENALYGVLMWLITPDGVHSDEAQIEYLRRCITAANDLETLAALQ